MRPYSSRVGLVGALAALVLAGPAAPSRAQSGLQITSDQALVLVSKDVAGSRWAIAATADLSQVTGNIFPLDGVGEPQFVFCRLEGTEGPAGSADELLTYACRLAENCAGTSCPSDGWQPIPPASLPRGFFQPSASTVSGVARVTGLARAAQDVPSGTQISPDGQIYLVNKDVGAERWAISFAESTGQVTGNVFVAGQEPSFVACRRVGDDENPDVNARLFTLECEGADSCRGGACEPGAWEPIATVDLPAGFFLARTAQTEEEVDLAVRGALDGRYLDLGYVSNEGTAAVSSVADIASLAASPAGTAAGLPVSPGSDPLRLECPGGGTLTIGCDSDADGPGAITRYAYADCIGLGGDLQAQDGAILYRGPTCVLPRDLLGEPLDQEYVDFFTFRFGGGPPGGEPVFLFGTLFNMRREVRYVGACGEQVRNQNGTIGVLFDDESGRLHRFGEAHYEFSDAADCADSVFTFGGGDLRVTETDAPGAPAYDVTFHDFETRKRPTTDGELVLADGDLRLSCNVLTTRVVPRVPLRYVGSSACPVAGEFDVSSFGARVARVRFTAQGAVEIRHESGRVDSVESCTDLPIPPSDCG